MKTSKKICVLVGAGDFSPSLLQQETQGILSDEIEWIAVDGGWNHLQKMSIHPNIVIGDFDSMQNFALKQGMEVLQLPREKDMTDMQAAIECALSKGHQNFLLFGALGGERFDHTFGNLQLCANLALRQKKVKIIGGDGTIIIPIYRESISLPARTSGIISVFSYTPISNGVTLSGLKYPLVNATLSYDTPLGVSNEFVGEPVKIKCTEGLLFIIFKR